MLAGEDLPGEAREALCMAAFEQVCALAIEKRAGLTPEKLPDIYQPPLSYVVGEPLLALMRPFADGSIAAHDAAKLRELAAALEKLAPAK
jgi:hypothetical protein